MKKNLLLCAASLPASILFAEVAMQIEFAPYVSAIYAFDARSAITDESPRATTRAARVDRCVPFRERGPAVYQFAPDRHWNDAGPALAVASGRDAIVCHALLGAR